MRAMMWTTMLVLLLAGCSSAPDPVALVGALAGDLACTEDPVVKETVAACITGAGSVAVSVVSSPAPFLALGLDNGEAGRLVVNDAGWVATAPTGDAAAELAQQLGDDLVTQAYYEREFAG